MKQIYTLTSLVVLLTFSVINAQTGPYHWQVQSINSISGENTYSQNATPNDIILEINQCSGGNVQPHNLTNYTLTWYVNSINSNSGGTVYSTSSNTTTISFNPTLNFTPPTDVTGTFYYYAEFSNPSMTTCGFTSTLTSPTVAIIVNAPTGPYHWQVQSVNSISGENTYSQNETPNDIILNINQCSGGNVQPHNLTNYTLTWYVNSINSNSGGTVYSTSSNTTTVSFNPTLNFTPPTDVMGTFYYYAEFSNPSMTTCGFTGTLTSPTVAVIVSETLGLNDLDNDEIKFNVFPNPASENIQIYGLNNTTNYILFTISGSEISSGKILKNVKIDIQNLNKGIYFLKLENGNTFKFIKE